MGNQTKKNILYNIVNVRQIDANVVTRLNQQLGINQSYAVVEYENELEQFAKESKYIMRKQAVIGDYTDCTCVERTQFQPLDDTILEAMAPHMMQLLKMQQRFEKQEQFRMPNTLLHHETLFMKNLEFWNNFLDVAEITHVFFNQVPHEVYDNIIYYLCKIKKIKTVVSYWSTLPNRSVMAVEYEKIEVGLLHELEHVKLQYMDHTVEEIPLCTQVEEHFQNMVAIKGRKTQLDKWYIRVSSLDSVFQTIFGYRNLRDKLILEIGSHTKRSEHTLVKVGIAIINSPRILGSLIRQRKQIRFITNRWHETKGLHQEYDQYAIIPEEEKYLYFALHFAPEATVAPMGGSLYMDQLIPLKILLHTIPEDWSIYVKIHPAQVYNEQIANMIHSLEQMPRIKLIKESYPTLSLIKEASVVATLTGTAAWEAQFMGVPALLFGYTEKSYAPLSYYVRTIEDCRCAIQSILAGEKSCTEKDLKIFVKALERVSIPNAYYDQDKSAVIERSISLFTE